MGHNWIQPVQPHLVQLIQRRRAHQPPPPPPAAAAAEAASRLFPTSIRRQRKPIPRSVVAEL
jgi:hypothetical protein